MTSFGIKTESVGTVVDTRWRTSAHGEDAARPGQINVADFSAHVGLVNPGYIPSGVAVSLVGGAIVPFTGGTTEAPEALHGFINDDEGVPAEGTYQTVAILRHGAVNPTYLPVEAQRTAVVDAAPAHFVLTEV